MNNDYEKVSTKAQTIRVLDKLRLALLLDDISSHPEKYPRNKNEWLYWLNTECGNTISGL